MSARDQTGQVEDMRPKSPNRSPRKFGWCLEPTPTLRDLPENYGPFNSWGFPLGSGFFREGGLVKGLSELSVKLRLLFW